MDELQKYIGKTAVVDTRGPFVYIGEIDGIYEHSVILKNADVHDIRVTSTSPERYLIESKKFGIRVNRKRVTVIRNKIISISLLDDIIDY